MPGAQAACPVVHQLLFEFQALRGPGRAPDHGDGQLPVAEIHHERRADRNVDQAFDQAPGARKVAHHRFIAVILVDQANLAQHGAAFGPVLAGAFRFDHPGAAEHGRAHFVRRDCGSVDKALDLLHAQRAHGVQFILRLDPFGGRIHLQGIGQADNRRDDRGVPAFGAGHAANEALVDLDLVERRVLQIAERGIAGPEVVEREPHAQQLQLREHVRRGIFIAQEDRLGQFQFQPLGLQAGMGQRLGDHRGKARIAELRGRHVDRHPHAARPGRRFGAGPLEHPIAQRADQVGFLGNRNEHPRRDFAQFGMSPARQGLQRHHLVALGIDDRLIDHVHLVMRQGIAQLFLDLAAALRFGMEFAGIEPELAAPAALRGIERQVGRTDQLFGIDPVVRGNRDPDRGTDDATAAFDLIGLADHGDDRPGDFAQPPPVIEIGNHDLEFVAAQPPDLAARFGDDALQAPGHLLEQFIARRMAQGIVDRLEPVEVHHHHGAAAL